MYTTQLSSYNAGHAASLFLMWMYPCPPRQMGSPQGKGMFLLPLSMLLFQAHSVMYLSFLCVPSSKSPPMITLLEGPSCMRGGNSQQLEDDISHQGRSECGKTSRAHSWPKIVESERDIPLVSGVQAWWYNG